MPSYSVRPIYPLINHFRKDTHVLRSRRDWCLTKLSNRLSIHVFVTDIPEKIYDVDPITAICTNVEDNTDIDKLIYVKSNIFPDDLLDNYHYIFRDLDKNWYISEEMPTYDISLTKWVISTGKVFNLSDIFKIPVDKNEDSDTLHTRIVINGKLCWKRFLLNINTSLYETFNI